MPQHTREIGMRMALGADPAGVLRMVIRQNASLAAAGIAAGLGGAFALTRLLKTMLFGVRVNDAPAFAGAPLALVFVVLLATLIPARRATRLSPALRYEQPVSDTGLHRDRGSEKNAENPLSALSEPGTIRSVLGSSADSALPVKLT